MNLLKSIMRLITFVLFGLAFISAVMALYMYYRINSGVCAAQTEACTHSVATLYASGLGIIGFSLSGLFALIMHSQPDSKG